MLSLFLPPQSPQPSSSGRAQFRKLAVDPACRCRGLGTALVETAVAEARLAGATSLFCHARSKQQGFYERLGFVRIGEPFAKYGGDAFYVEMELPLASAGLHF